MPLSDFYRHFLFAWKKTMQIYVTKQRLTLVWNEGTVNNWQPTPTVNCYILVLSFRLSAFCVEEVIAFVGFYRVRRKDLDHFPSYQDYLFFSLLAIPSDFAKSQPYCLCTLHEYYQENLKRCDVTWYKGPLYIN